MMYQGGAGASGKRVDALESGREAFRTQRWSDAFSYFSSADRENPVEPGDLALWAQSAFLLGRDAEGGELLARAHQAFLGRGDTQLAARCAFWMGFSSMIRGDIAQAGGWLSRAARLLEGRPDC